MTDKQATSTQKLIKNKYKTRLFNALYTLYENAESLDEDTKYREEILECFDDLATFIENRL